MKRCTFLLHSPARRVLLVHEKFKERGVEEIATCLSYEKAHHSEGKFSRKSAVVTYARNVKKDSSPSELTDLIVVPSPTSPTDIGFPHLSSSLFSSTLFFASSYALRRRHVSSGRKFHLRIAQLIPRSFPRQPAKETTTPRCVLSKLDTYRSLPPPSCPSIPSTNLFLPPFLFFSRGTIKDIVYSHYDCRRRRSRKNFPSHYRLIDEPRELRQASHCITWICISNKSDLR